MKPNVGRTDQIIRGVVGLVILVLGTVLGSYWGWLGLVLLVSAASAWCPIYRIIGFSTLRQSGRDAGDTTKTAGA